MRTVAILLVALMALYIVPGMVSAKNVKPIATKAAVETLVGKIVSIDTANNTVTIKEGNNGLEKLIVVDQKLISTLKVGEKVKISLKTGSKLADSVKELK